MGSGSSTMPEAKELTSDNASTGGTGDVQKKPACKSCCACPETKRVRDACIVERGEENCRDLIEAHKECMRKQGFNI